MKLLVIRSARVRKALGILIPFALIFDENCFCATSANRICRGWYDGVATVEDAAQLCRMNGGRA